jgi:hypothetical protein
VAFAANEKCNDIDGDDSGATDAYTCPNNYDAKSDLNVDISGAGDEAAKTALCCDAKTYTGATVTLAGTVTAIPHSNYAATTMDYTYPPPALTCDYLTPVNTVTATAAAAADGAVTLTVADTAGKCYTDNAATTEQTTDTCGNGSEACTAANCAASCTACVWLTPSTTSICTAPPTYTDVAVTYAGTVSEAIAHSNYAATTMTYTYPAPALACICGGTMVNTVTATITALNAAGETGAITVTVADTADPDTEEAAICPAPPAYLATGQCYTDTTKATTTTDAEADCTGGTKTWVAAVVVTGPIANSNYSEATLAYTCGSLPEWACNTGYTAVSTVTVTTATTDNATGAVTVTIADTATPATLADAVCVKDTPSSGAVAATAAAMAAGVAAMVL